MTRARAITCYHPKWKTDRDAWHRECRECGALQIFMYKSSDTLKKTWLNAKKLANGDWKII